MKEIADTGLIVAFLFRKDPEDFSTYSRLGRRAIPCEFPPGA
jgi:hypothetical protein